MCVSYIWRYASFLNKETVPNKKPDSLFKLSGFLCYLDVSDLTAVPDNHSNNDKCNDRNAK